MSNNAMDRAAENAQAVMRSTRTWEPGLEPTARQWSAWFRSLTAENAECVAYYLLLRMAAEDQCFVADHTGSIRDLESVIGRVQAENRRLRAQLLQHLGPARQTAGEE